MAFTFFKSKEGVEEYAKIGQKYPDHANDQLFEHYQQLVAWDSNKKERITEIRRVKRFDDSEWLVYSESYEGHDRAYGRRHHCIAIILPCNFTVK